MGEQATPGGARAGGFSPTGVTVAVPPGGAIASGISPTAIIAAALLPPLAEALRQLEQLSTFHPHEPPDHHDPVVLYTDAGVALAAFVIATYLLFRRLRAQ